MNYSERNVSRIFYPVISQLFVLNLINIIDSLMLGRYSNAHISGISIANRIFSIPNGLLTGLVATCAVFIAQYYGKNDSENMERVFKISFIISITFVLPLSIIGIIMPKTILSFFTNDKSVIMLGSIYLQYVALSLIPYSISQCISNAIKSIGIVKKVLYASVVTVIAKVFLNYILLCYPFSLDMAGAGISLLLSRSLECAFMLILLGNENCTLSIAGLFSSKVNYYQMKRVLKKMLPLGLNEFLYGISQSLIFKQYGYYNSDILAGYSIAVTYFELFRVMFATSGFVINVFVVPLLGKGEYTHAIQTVKKIFIYCVKKSVLLGLVLIIGSISIPFIYKGTPLAIFSGQKILFTMGILFPLSTVHTLYYFIFRSGGDNTSIILYDSLFYLALVIPFQYLCIIICKIPIEYTYAALEFFLIIRCFFAHFLVKRKRWLCNLTK